MEGDLKLLAGSVGLKLQTSQQHGNALTQDSIESRAASDHDGPAVTLPVFGTDTPLIHELFEEQVRRTPAAVALVHEAQSLTYTELNARANEVAHRLVELGVRADSLVGICVERSVEMVVGLIGILKAGGAYVPLDPSYPPERLRFMLADANPSVLLTQASLSDKFPTVRCKVITIDSGSNETGAAQLGNLDARSAGLRCQHLAYVIYTSGSTGEPKGVMVEHRNVTRLFSVTAQWLCFNEQDVWTLFHSVAFDFSVWELWGALLHGGKLVIVPHVTSRSPHDFYHLVCAHRVTVLNQTPSAFSQLIDAQAAMTDQRHALRCVIFGGEALELRTLKPWIERNGIHTPRLINMYGITETTVHVTYHQLSEQDFQTSRGSIIGMPLPDLQLYVLDQHGQVVPSGVAGEIHVGGAGVARGYLNRPELTNERFRPDPLSAGAGGRLYKTGDLGRYASDGTLEYLGRNDHQVKIRGFRIELGEIEALLARHASVKEALVIAREDVPGDKRLVAYVILRSANDGNTATGVEHIRAYLKDLLPEYMVPKAFVTLRCFPLTMNGKLDRRALPPPELTAYVNREYHPPQGELEECLSQIWRDLLQVERVGRLDNFFELGGHSLLIARMMERLHKAGLSAPVSSVLGSSTLADLAAALNLHTTGQVEAPPNLIPTDCRAITPEMLPLIVLNSEQIDQITQTVPGGAANIQDIYPLTPLQEGFLFHHVLDEQGGGDTYVLPILLSLSSRDRLEDLLSALQRVVDRHDILRTAVLWEHLPRPVQVVYRQVTVQADTLVLDSEHDPIEQLQGFMKPECQRLDIRQAPMMRLRIAADPRDERWYALLQLHHLAHDHESMDAMLSEVVAHLEKREHALPAPVGYRQHVAQVLAQSHTLDAEAFFRGKLGDLDEPTAPFGLLDVQGDGGWIDEFRQQLEPSLARRVRTRARGLNVGPATLFHSAWALVVSVTSGRDDVVFGTLLSGRLHATAEARRALGMFINTLPLRIQLKGVTAEELIRRMQREVVALLDYEQSSLAVAQRCSGIGGSAPLFSSLLNYLHAQPHPASDVLTLASGLHVLASREWTNYPITLAIEDQGDAFLLIEQTDRRIGTGRVTEYLKTALLSLLDALETAPWTLADSLSVLPESERRHVVDVCNDTSVEFPDGFIHSLFEEQAQRKPRANAVECEQESITYAELNGKANSLARYLRAKGIGPNHIVVLYVVPGLEMVIGILGVLKTGAAYLPLDPNHPGDRLQYMLENAAPRVVLTQKRLKHMLPRIPAELVLLDEEWTSISLSDTHDLDCNTIGLTQQHLAYVIYTSGSTGEPKGVMVTHQNLMASDFARKHFYGEPGCFLLLSSPAFDSSIAGIFGTLAHGGTLVIPTREAILDPESLVRTLQRTRATSLLCVPALYSRLLDLHGSDLDHSALTRVVVAGEACPTTLVHESARLAPRIALFNEYGPTEATVWATVFECRDLEGTNSVPIGRPIANTQIHILDRCGRPVPVGVSGEIYIGGAGVTRGYLNRPDLTAERFVADPRDQTSGARVYKTGDLGRWRADGNVEYLGRNDHQVKIRGFRIELGEVETHLLRHSLVRDAVVLAREDVPGEKRLVAYVTSRDDKLLSAETLRTHLQTSLPHYMVPGVFVVLQTLPLTPNGKVDRRALPPPGSGIDSQIPYEAPMGAVEEALSGIWKELLQVERVGRHDSFFALGGHSLVAMQMRVRIRALLSVTISMRAIFNSPTLEELSAEVDRLRQAQIRNRLVEGGDDVEELLDTIASMSEGKIQELTRALRSGGQS